MPAINRRDALKIMGAAAGSSLLPLSRGRAGSSRPNLIFILTDDHRFDAFGFMDKPWLKTPNLDRLAREGVHFENSFVTTSLCSPSRASFLTGQSASCHGVKNNFTPWREDNVTFLELVHAAGWRTGFIGKWHMPGRGVPDLKGQGKVDRMVSFSAAGGQGIYHDCPMIEDGRRIKPRGYITDVLTDYALEFMNESKDRPFCLYLSHKAVHHDFTPPERHRGKLANAPLNEMEDNERGFPMGLVHVPQRMNFTRNQQRYYEALMGVDDSVGRVLDLLDEQGRAENTLVVYAGDNGYFWGEHGLIDKRYAYEEGIRIPHLMRFPALLPDGGLKAGELVLNLDLAPTMLEAAGIAAPSSMQGKSYLEADRLGGREFRESFLYEYFRDPGFPHPEMRAVRTPDWKLITYPDSKRFPDELYHLAEDPGERNDLINDPAAAKKLAELRAELARLEKENSCPPR